jgi:hypothetical protein
LILLQPTYLTIVCPGQSHPAVNDRFFSYLIRFVGTVLRTVFVVPYTVSNCRKSPENRVSDRLRSFTTRWNTTVILRIWNESNTTRKRPEMTVHVTFFDGYGGRNHCPGWYWPLPSSLVTGSTNKKQSLFFHSKFNNLTPFWYPCSVHHLTKSDKGWKGNIIFQFVFVRLDYFLRLCCFLCLNFWLPWDRKKFSCSN